MGAHSNQPEVLTPTMDQLISDGILLERTYSFMFCSPTVAPLDCNPEAKALVAAGLLPASPPPLAGG